MKVLVTGGAGFIGSHIAEHYKRKGCDVTVYDNLHRGEIVWEPRQNLPYLQSQGIKYVYGDVTDEKKLENIVKPADLIVHAAGQTTVTDSMTNPRDDFMTNALGTFTLLDTVRRTGKKPTIIYLSTNKVYGENVNKIPIVEGEKSYNFADRDGVNEEFGLDLTSHTPYGCSKLTGDLYMQDFAEMYGLRTGVFRMSCIYGTRQLGMEGQGWLDHIVKQALKGNTIKIYGDGKQVRDVLYVTDLVKLFDAYYQSNLGHQVFNTGGGKNNILSLIHLIDILKKEVGEVKLAHHPWRPADQKVYISDISKAKKMLNWEPTISPEEGVKNLIEWNQETLTKTF